MKERGGAVGAEEGVIETSGSVASPVDVVGWSPSTKVPLAAVNPVKVMEEKSKAWNSRNLGWRVGADATAAASAGVLIAPIITIIDR
jgi:hypothetical protein